MAMTLTFSKMPWYGQVAAVAVLGLGGAGAFWNFHAQAAQQGIDAQRAQLADLHSQIQRGKAAERRLPEFRRELAVLEARMAHLRAVLPDERDVADLLRRVQGMATESSLTILGFAPKPVAKKTMYVEWPIGLKLEGNYHDLGAFLERVSKFPRIINVSDLKVKAIDKPVGPATITAEAIATTFVLVEPERAQPAAGAAPGKPGAAPAAAKPAGKTE
jgi:type IV pilus assembly protein PilO